MAGAWLQIKTKILGGWFKKKKKKAIGGITFLQLSNGYYKIQLESSKVHLQGCICLLIYSQKVTKSCHKVKCKVCHMWDKEPAHRCGRSSPVLHDRHGDFCVFLCVDSTVCMCNLLSLAQPQKAAIHLKA